MTFFNPTEPIIRRKQHALDFQDRQGLLHLRLKIKNTILFSNLYTRIDQVFVVWGLISGAIFITGQFAPISWVTQAIFWSVLTVVGTIVTIGLTHFWVAVERLQWILYSWVVLMLVGVTITDLGIFLGWGQVLLHLSHLWLGLCGIGYFCTGIGLRSRAFILSGIIHASGIALLPHVAGWQFLTTGLIMVANLLVFAETQWDMRLPIENYALLTEEQKQFNYQQQQLREAIN
ncbi:MAG: hypothetical protein MUD14_08385 [Hydrococcus sp. Prado102]|jgi:hypothetical protein|nr:hypothetical protein [Hydrococcus sp. Prado102]